MPNRKSQRWTPGDNAKLRSLAGRYSPEGIARQLGRTPAAIIMQASKLKLSLRTGVRPNPSGIDARTAGFNLAE